MIYLFFLLVVLGLMSGFPVAFTLGGVSVCMAILGSLTGTFDSSYLQAIPERLFGIMNNESLIAIPLFILMGMILERSKLSEDLIEVMGRLFGKIKGGIGLSVCIVGALLAASTGVVGATVVSMGLISLPVMLKKGYSKELSTGLICASGSLGQLIPPSIVLIILGDVLASANQQAQLRMGNFMPESLSISDLFLGALIPGVLLVSLYMVYVLFLAYFRKDQISGVESMDESETYPTLKEIVLVLFPPLFLMISVLGSILFGFSTATEAASVGVFGALLITALKKRISLLVVKEALQKTVLVSGMIFTILVGATLFSLVFRGFGGDELVQEALLSLGDHPAPAFFIVMLLMFFLGFFLDFFEIVFIMIPLVGPVLIQLGMDPLWLGVMIAMNLQTSFLTPPFGFSLFYLKGVCPSDVETKHIYRGVIPFIGIQLLGLALVYFFPSLVLWLPGKIF